MEPLDHKGGRRSWQNYLEMCWPRSLQGVSGTGAGRSSPEIISSQVSVDDREASTESRDLAAQSSRSVISGTDYPADEPIILIKFKTLREIYLRRIISIYCNAFGLREIISLNECTEVQGHLKYNFKSCHFVCVPL